MAMIHMTPGKEYSFMYEAEDGSTSLRTILFTGLSLRQPGAKEKIPTYSVYLRGYDVDKKEYRTFNLGRVDKASITYVRG